MVGSRVGKAVLVTGAAGDIGHVIAEVFLRRRATVVASDVREAELLERVASLASLGKVYGKATDLADTQAVTKLAEDALGQVGRIDILVNNAALQPEGDVEECISDVFDLAYAVNVRAPYLLCHALTPAMRAEVSGAIVNISSVHATTPGPRRLAYATTKTTLLGMTRSMAVDLGSDNIRVNALSPGATMTSQLRETWNRRQAKGCSLDIFEHAARQHPLGCIAEVSDIAEAAVFLAEASFISGMELRVDGGFLSSLRLLPTAHLAPQQPRWTAYGHRFSNQAQ